jgi:hypothetical protein
MSQYISREQVLEAFRPLVAAGFTNPDDLPLEDAQVTAANALLDAWHAQEERRATSGREAAAHEHNLSRSTVLIDAGFTDPGYLSEVADDWLPQDAQRALDRGLPELAAKIRAKIDEIRGGLR